MDTLSALLKAAGSAGTKTVLVTVIGTEGSAPGKPGAAMLVGPDGLLGGTVGGGPSEYRAICLAKERIGQPGAHIETLPLQNVGSICGGAVTLLFIPTDERAGAIFEAAQRMRREDRPVFLSIDTESGEMTLLTEDARPGLCERDGRKTFVQRLGPRGKVCVFGGGHVAQALVPLLSKLEFSCIVLEDREEFCSPERFPDAADCRHIDLHDIGASVRVSEADMIVIMTRGHIGDLEAAAFALTTPAHYIGVMGSRAKMAATKEKLLERGFTERDYARLTTPIGLPILAKTPAEIAVSVAAQMIQIRAQRETGAQ